MAIDTQKWSRNVILADADYLDKVAFDLIVNFERMINRKIPAADLPHWLDCIALDGGLEPGDNKIQALFLHAAGSSGFKNFVPSDFRKDLDAKAFKDNMGEFLLNSFKIEEIVTAEEFFKQSLETILQSKEVEKLMLIGDMEQYGSAVVSVLKQNVNKKDITLFAMNPVAGRGFSQEILGYSLMSALGIKSDEIMHD